jgi:drug/metabolite transporter (DMT)-like permease
MPFPYAGEICSLAAPLVWSVALILYKQTNVPAASMNLFKNSLALALLVVTLVATGAPLPVDRPVGDWLLLVASALLGLAVADTLLFFGLARVDASKVAIVDTLYAPFVVLAAWLVLGEAPTLWFLAGAGLVVVGLAMATIQRGAWRLRRREEVVGLGIVAAAVLCNALGVVLAKPVLARSGLVEVTASRLLIGLIVQSAWLASRGALRPTLSVFRPSPEWRTLVPAAVLGAYVSMLLWLGGYKWADASLSAVLNQSATVYMLGLAALFLGERLRPVQVGGALVAAVGAAWIVATG